MYKCKHCSYTSRRAFDLRRHQNRKTPCFTVIPNDQIEFGGQSNESIYGQNISSNRQRIIPNGQNIIPNGQNIIPNGQNIIPNGQNIVPTKLLSNYCENCNKQLSDKRAYIRHLKICKGHDSKTCPTCKKQFNSYQARWKHMRTVKCTPPPPPPPASSSNASINCTINNTINNNNIDNSQNINITLNFGQEALEKLCDQPDYLKRMEEVVRLGKYALPQHLSDIYFNDSFPMNNTIMKTRHNDRFVKIKTGENEWNLRAMDDVYKSLTQRMESYMNPYFKHVERQMEKIYDEDQQKFKRLTRSIREFGHKVLWLDWNCNDIRQIGVELNDPYCENERHRRIQEMKTLLLEHIYDKTKEMLELN